MLKYIFQFFSLLNIFFYLTSCNNTTEKKNINDEINKVNNSIKTKKDKFDYDLLNKQKIFLKYWSGMNYHEFFKVTELLEKEGIVSKKQGDFYYNMGNSELRIDRYFSKQDYISYNGYTHEKGNDISTGINLWGFDEITYNIFKKKYNLPDYIIKKSAEFILEENPLYLDENKDEYTIGRFIRNFDIRDNLQFIGGKENQLNYSPFFFDYEFASRITVPEEIIIKKGNIVIMINDVMDISDPKTYSGCYYKDKVEFLYYNNNKKEKYRIVRISNYSDLRITYIDRTYYEKIEKKEKKSELDDLNLKNKEENQIKQRTNSIQNEI